MTKEKVVIRRPVWGNLLLVLGCAAFVAAGFYLMQTGDFSYRIIGIVSIVFFGGGGLFYMICSSWRPIVVISDEGITVPYGWGKNTVLWHNVKKFEIVTQNLGAGGKQQYIGIYAFDSEGIVGTGKKSRALTQKITGWETVPDMSISLGLSFVKIEKVMEMLQEYHERYQARRPF